MNRYLTILSLLTACADPLSAKLADAVPTDSAAADTASTDTSQPEAASLIVIITELMADNDDFLVIDGETPDWIELYNPGPASIDLTDWTLTDAAAPEPFSEAILLPGEFLVVLTSALSFGLDRDGESLELRDASGALVDWVDFGPQQPDVSWGRPQRVASEVLLDDGDVARMAAGPPEGWAEPSLDDSGWEVVILPVGFDDTHESTGTLALFAETDQSSDGYGYTGAQAVDGEWDTFSHTGDGDLFPWLRVDLGTTASITSLQILNRLSCCAERLYNITVEVLDADEQAVWTSALLNPVSEGSTPVSPGDTLDPGLGEVVEGRFVRVSKEAVNGAGSSEWLSLGELEVTGALTAPYDAWIQTDGRELLSGGEAAVRVDIPEPSTPPDRLTLAVRADDAFEAYFDGSWVAESNLSALEPVEVEQPVVYTLPPDAGGLLAVRLVDVDGEDALLGLTLTAEVIDTLTDEVAWFDPPTPGAPNGMGFPGFVAAPSVSPERGWLDGPTTVRISTTTPDAEIIYTLDGTAPSEDNGVFAGGGEVMLDLSETTLLRALAVRNTWGDSPVVTHTFLELDGVLSQPTAPAGLPETWDGLSQDPIAADYEMDPEVVEDPLYNADLRDGLRAIPSLSLVMDPADLWGEQSGIYVHSTQRGEEWERPASIEIIEPDGSSFQGDCGVRMHGYGWRPHSNTRKHSMRLEFRSEYGEARLAYPLFPEAPVERFDSIVLRAQGSRSWQDFRDPAQAQYIRDAFARDTALAMGKEDGHAAYVHLYLNGLYWGLYMAVERPDADFGAERFGGDADEYDAINRRTTTNEAIDGDLLAYEALLALSDEDLTGADAYQAVADLIDIDDLIDYMLIHQYTSNRDGPEEFSHNNMRGVRRRVDGERFRFFVWDMEYSLWDADYDINIDVDVAGSVSHVYARLRSNDEFRARYAARAAEHLGSGGPLSPAASLARWEARSLEIEDAIIGESARWGDADREVPYTRDVEWVEEHRRLVEAYFPYRTDVLIEQLEAAGLY
jgi:hypothetical protein